MADDFNSRIIEEFRANAGKVGGGFEGAPMILVHHRGVRSGEERVTPLVYLPVGGNFAVFASAAGAPRDPQWYRNLMARPDTVAEVGADTVEVRAREAAGEERDTIFARQKELMPGFADYEQKTEGVRTIPVVVLERR